MASTLFSPLVTGPLLAGITYAPEATSRLLAQVTEKLSETLPEHVFNQVLAYAPSLGTTQTTLQVLLGLGIIHHVNKTLSMMAHNSWRLRATQWDWPKEIAIVTGGCSGIGFATVERLLALGIKVAILDVQELPKDFQGRANLLYARCDVTSTESIKAAADAVRAEFGHPTILINNAGITRPMPLMDMPEDFLRKIFGVNCMALWFTTQQFLPEMIKRNKGHVVTLASIASFIALPKGVDYAATKAAALAFHEGLACELKHHHKADRVLTTVVHPFFAKTPLIDSITDDLQQHGIPLLSPEGIADKIVAQIRSGRGGQMVLPWYIGVLSQLRGWPSWLQELARDGIGRDAFR